MMSLGGVRGTLFSRRRGFYRTEAQSEQTNLAYTHYHCCIRKKSRINIVVRTCRVNYFI